MENEYLINQIKKLTGQLSQELNGNKTQGIKNKPMIIVALIIVLVLSLLFDYYEAKRLFDLYGGSLNFLPVILSTMISTSFVWLLLVYFNKVNFKNQHLNEMLLDMKDLTDSFIENQNKKIEQPGNEKSTLLNVIEFLPDAIFVVDNDNRIIFWNGMMETITGLNKCEVIGRDYNKIIPIIYGKEIDLMIDYMLNGKLEEISNDELGIYRNIKRRGDTINAEVSFPNAYNSRIAHCWISVSPLYNENGDKVGYIESIRDITEKKIMEDKLKTSHQFNQDILDSLSEQIAVLNKNGDIIAVNQSWNRFADENNSSRDKVGKGVNYLKVCRDSLENGNEDSGIVIEGIQSILDRKSKDFTFEYPCHSPAEKRWFALYASAMNNSKGVVVSHIDITRRKLKEEILKRYQLLVTHTTDIILFFDEKGNILEANKTAVKSYGYSRDELLQLSIHTIRGRDSFAVIEKQMKKAQKESILFEAKHYRKNNSTFPVEVNCTGVKIGEETVLISIIRDLTERKEHQRQLEEIKMKNLKRQTQMFSDIFQAVPVGIMLIDEDFVVRRVNDLLLKIKLSSSEELIGKVIGEGFDCCFLNECSDGCGTGEKCKVCRFRCSIETTLKTGKSIRNLEAVSKINVNNKTISSIFKINTVRMIIDEKTYVLLSLEDISQYKMVQARLNQAIENEKNANKAKGNFLAKMSHEIRTPMNGIIGMTELTLKTQLSEEQNEYLNIVKKSANNLLSIINDILDYSKIEAGKMELDRKEFDLYKLLHNTVRVMGINARAKGLDVIYENDNDFNRNFMGDPVKIQQILYNLIGNSVKFTEEGKISVRHKILYVDEENKKLQLKIWISDTGIGIPEYQANKLFESFTQLNKSSKYMGAGLGLAITKQLVEMMDGTIEVRSQLNKGTIISFTLNLEYIDKKQGLSDKADNVVEFRSVFEEKENITNKSYSILVAEDNNINQKLVEAYLKKENFNYKIVSNGKEVFQEFTNNSYDLILMDISMPEVDGYTATRMIRNEESASAYIPIIAMTAYARNEDREKCLAAGMDDYISKPIDIKEFYRILKKYLKNSSKKLFHLNKDKISEIMLEDTVLLNNLVDRVLITYPDTIVELFELLQAKNYANLKLKIHRFKGSIANFGAEKAQKILTTIEDNIDNENHIELQYNLELFDQEMEILKSYLLNLKEGLNENSGS